MLKGQSGYVESLAWSPDGIRLAGNRGYPVQIQDAITGGAYTVAWWPDSRTPASGGGFEAGLHSGDFSVRLLNAGREEQMAVFGLASFNITYAENKTP